MSLWADHRPALTFEGELSGTTILRIQGDRLDIDNHGSVVNDPHYRFIYPLADYALRIDVEARAGSARARVLEQPSRRNNYTAIVEVRPFNRRGSQHVALDFFWDDRSNTAGARNRNRGDGYGYGAGYGYGTRSRADDRSNGPGEARWTGQVDGRVRVSFRDSRAWSQRISGQETYNEQVSFVNSIPRGTTDVSLNKLRGRGEVEIIERPSASNNYTTVVEINDSDGGSDHYEVALAWR